MKHNITWWLVGVASLCFWSCKHQTPEQHGVPGGDIVAQAGDVFVSGSVIRNGKRNACFWENETVTVLDESVSSAMDIFLTDHDILLGGESDGKPCYWLNGKKIMVNLPGNGVVTSVQIRNDLIYAIGYIHDGPVRTRGFLIKGGTASYLNAYSGYATDFTFDGADLYVAGVDDGRPCYWKNEVLVPLSERGDVVSIAALNGMVTVAGENLRGELRGNGIWTDGRFKLLNKDFQSTKKLLVHEGKIYLLGNGEIVAGKNGATSNGFVETDGKQVGVVAGSSDYPSTVVDDIFFNESVMYILGTAMNSENRDLGSICYWIDGEIHFVSSEKYALATALAIR